MRLNPHCMHRSCDSLNWSIVCHGDIQNNNKNTYKNHYKLSYKQQVKKKSRSIKGGGGGGASPSLASWSNKHVQFV